MASRLPVISREETNFLRIANLLLRVSPRAVRTYFNTEFHPIQLKATLNRNWVTLDSLRRRYIITKTQWNTLFPTGKEETSSVNFDITVMSCLLRHLADIDIQDDLPRVPDANQGTAVSTIKFYRNQIAHSGTGCLSDDEFNDMWKMVEKAIVKLDKTMQRDCDVLREAELDHSFRDVYLDFLKAEKELENMKLQLDQLNIEQRNIEEIRNRTIQVWLRKMEKFYVTRATHSIMKIVKENQYTVITGISGSGKTINAYYTALQLQQNEGFVVIPANGPDDFIKSTVANTKQIYIFDDALGKHLFDEYQFNCWDKHSDNVHGLGMRNPHNTKVIITCRSHLYDKNKFQDLGLPIVHFSMNDPDYTLSLQERREIAKLYLSDEAISNLNDYVIMLYNFFPLLCEHFSERGCDNIDFFIKPDYFVERDIKRLKSTHDNAYIALVLLVVCSNQINKQLLQITDQRGVKIINDIIEESELNHRPSKKLIYTSMERLTSTYLRETESCFTSMHDRVFDMVSQYIGPSFIHSILLHGESSFIGNRLKFESIKEEDDDLLIGVPRESEELYFSRMYDDLKQGLNWTVFSNVQTKYIEYRKCFVEYLTNIPWIEFAKSLSDGSTALHVSSSRGYLNFAEFIVEKDASQINATDDQGRAPLHEASLNGHLDLVEYLINKNALIDNQDKNLETPLLFAARCGYLKVAEILIKNGADVNKENQHGWTPIRAACFNGFLDLAKFLFANTADLNQEDEARSTPLSVACQNGHVDIIKFLLDHDATVNITSRYSPLYMACQCGYVDIVQILLDHAAEINTGGIKGWTPLHVSCHNTKTEVPELLIKYKAKIDQADNNGWTALHVACIYGHDKIAELLIAHNALVNRTDNYGRGPLHFACVSSNKSLVTLLLQNGAVVNQEQEDGATPLHIVCCNGFNDLTELLLEHGANVDQCTDKGHTPLYAACKKGHTKVVKTLLVKNASVEHVTTNGLTALDIACRKNRIDTVKLLLAHDINIQKTTSRGASTLHIACENENMLLVGLLLIYGADVNQTDMNGWTPLHVACMNGLGTIVGLLIAHGAKIDQVLYDDWTALHVACQLGNTNIVELLLKHKATVNKTSKGDHMSPLHFACEKDNKDMVTYLLENEAVVNQKNINNWTPMHFASRDGFVDIVTVLIQHKADVNYITKDGITPLMLACDNEHKHVVEVLLKNDVTVNQATKDGITPLHIGVQKNLKDIEELLLKYNAI